MTIIYIIRHSEALRTDRKYCNESDQLFNEKQVLSVRGENRAKSLSEYGELGDIDVVISSHYSRAIGTAKYIAERNNLTILLNENFKERMRGVNFSEMPSDFIKRQFHDEDFKLGSGESRKEVSLRMGEELSKVLEEYSSKKIVIVSHTIAILSLFKTWCDMELNDGILKITFGNIVVFENEWKAPEMFKLVFDDNKELVSIENIVIDY